MSERHAQGILYDDQASLESDSSGISYETIISNQNYGRDPFAFKKSKAIKLTFLEKTLSFISTFSFQTKSFEQK